MKDIFENELNYPPNIEEDNLVKMDDLTSGWQNSFSMFEQDEAKNVIEGLFTIILLCVFIAECNKKK